MSVNGPLSRARKGRSQGLELFEESNSPAVETHVGAHRHGVDIGGVLASFNGSAAPALRIANPARIHRPLKAFGGLAQLVRAQDS
jgi:hypothetical protein